MITKSAPAQLENSPRYRSKRRLPLHIIGVLALGAFAMSARAQTTSSAFENALNTLAGSNTVLPTVTVPAGVLPGTQGSAQWNFARAGLMLQAADVATHNSFGIRSAQLYQEAAKSLTAAQQNSLSSAQAGQCEYLLGYLAERVSNDLNTAQVYYQQAVASDPTNTRASNALVRVQLYLARIERQ